jgi:diguanylate cyclase (GGDEF)-like protein
LPKLTDMHDVFHSTQPELTDEKLHSRANQVLIADRCGRPLHTTNALHQLTIDKGAYSTLFDLIHPMDRQQAIEAFRSVADGFELDRHFRIRTISKDSGFRVVEVLVSAPRDFLPIDGIMVTFADMTASATTEALHSISRRIALSPLEQTDQVVEDAFGDAMLATGLSSTTLFVPGKSGSVFHVVKTKHVVEASKLKEFELGPLTIDMPSLKIAIQERRAVVVHAGEDSATWDAVHLDHLLPLHHIVIVPLFAAVQLEGIAVFGSTEANHRLDPYGMHFLETVSELIAGAMARQRTSHELHDRAFRDPLTHLPNRRLLTERLDEAMGRIRRTKNWVALIVIDCDGFKEINDAFGHQVGDAVLVSVAERLQSVCRSGELVARFGGDEFVVMLESELPEATIGALGQRIVEVLDTVYEFDGTTSHMTASVGVAVHRGDADPLDATAMFKRADLAMYRAKQAGKNRVVLFTEEMEAATRDRFELTADLRTAMKRQTSAGPLGSPNSPLDHAHDHAHDRALDHAHDHARPNELSLWYQPVVDVATTDLVGYEALIRWQHPTRGLLFPASFIELAEESGQIVELGWLLMDMALDQFRGWRKDGLISKTGTLAVNLSIRQLTAPNFHHTIASIIEQSKVPPHLIELELTETVFADRETVVPRLRELQALGVNLSIDDFGTGYSSLAYLRDLPVDIVKMDKSFIQRLGTDPRDDALVSALIKVAHELGLVTIAEGVETDTQIKQLQMIDCDKAQGYWFGRPQPEAVTWSNAAENLKLSSNG